MSRLSHDFNDKLLPLNEPASSVIGPLFPGQTKLLERHQSCNDHDRHGDIACEYKLQPFPVYRVAGMFWQERLESRIRCACLAKNNLVTRLRLLRATCPCALEPDAATSHLQRSSSSRSPLKFLALVPPSRHDLLTLRSDATPSFCTEKVQMYFFWTTSANEKHGGGPSLAG